MSTTPRKLRVLIACERSQVERDAFAACGCDSWSMDIEPCYGSHPERHIQADAYTFPLSGWDLIVAHPPCTELSHVNNRRRNLPNRVTPVVRALRLWARFLFESPCPVCVENPVGICNEILPPDQIICPSFFGEPYKKRTCLWLRGLPPLIHGVHVCNPSPWVGGGKVIGVAQQVCGVTRKDRPRARSQSFAGVAAAMAEQWTSYLLQK